MPNKIGTLIPLPNESRIAGFSHIFRLTAADVAQLTSGVAQAVIPPNLLGAATSVIPAGMVIRRIAPCVVTAFTFSGGDTGTLVYTLGDGGTPTRFVISVTLKTAGWGTTQNLGYTYPVADTIDIIVTAATQAKSMYWSGGERR